MYAYKNIYVCEINVSSRWERPKSLVYSENSETRCYPIGISIKLQNVYVLIYLFPLEEQLDEYSETN